MRETRKVFDSKPILQVLLAIANGAENQWDVVKETGIKQPIVSQYLKQLEREEVIKRNKAAYFKVIPLQIDPQPIIFLNFFSEDPHLKKPKHLERLNSLNSLALTYFSKIAINPFWRNRHYLEKIEKEGRIGYSLWPELKDRDMISGAASFMSHPRFGKRTIRDLARQFNYYLLIQLKENTQLTNKQRENIIEYLMRSFSTLDGYYLSEDNITYLG